MQFMATFRVNMKQIYSTVTKCNPEQRLQRGLICFESEYSQAKNNSLEAFEHGREHKHNKWKKDCYNIKMYSGILD